MSLQSSFEKLSPAVVASAGAVALVGMPWVPAASVSVWKGANAAAFALNCLTVSIPGRIDSPEALTAESGDVEDSPSEYVKTYSVARGRALLAPSGWAFSIWGPIYLGEAAWIVAQFFPQSGLETYLPLVSIPFVSANLCQSLWCASFRPQYNKGWARFVSAGMLGGTAFSLYQLHDVAATATGSAFWLMMPLSMHFGWTTAASLVNLSGSVAMDTNTSDQVVNILGHCSVAAATVLAASITVHSSSPVYGCTLAWALAACADGMSKRDTKAARRQKHLCWAGAAVCAASAVSTCFM